MSNIFNRIIAAVRALVVARNATDIIDLSAATTGGVQMAAGGRIGCKIAAPPGRPDGNYMQFDPITVGVGGGGCNYSKTGITSVTDAGAAGIALVYASAGNTFTLGTAATVGVIVSPTETIIRGSANVFIDLLSTYIGLSMGTGAYDIQFRDIGNQLNAGWLLAKGVELLNDENQDAVAARNSWTDTTPAGATITTLANLHATQLFSPLTTPVFRVQPLSLTLGDAPRSFFRFLTAELAATRKSIGWSDAPDPAAGGEPYAAAGNAALWYFDDTVSARHILRLVRAGAVTDIVAGALNVVATALDCDLVSTAAGVVTLAIGGTVICTGAAINAPLPATVMRDIEFAANTGVAVASNLRVCRHVTVMSKRAGATL